MKIRVLLAAGFMLFSMLLSACDSGTSATSTPAAGTTGSTPDAGSTGNTSGSTGGSRKIVVSSKNFTEEVILGELYAVALEGAGFQIDRKLNLGTTAVAHEALLKGGANGGIDLYPEYTSTGLVTVLKQQPIQDPEKAYQAVKDGYVKLQPMLIWLDKTPMNDTQAVVTTQENSQKLGLKSLADLCSQAKDLTIAARAEFQTREDALPSLQKTYGGCQFKEIKVVESNLLYKALTDKQVDVAQADGTAGEISGYNLVLLADPKNYGPPDNVAPVIREDLLSANPKIAEVLNKVSAKITNPEMTAMNWQVSGKGADPHDVAKEWLYKQGLIPK